VNIPHDKSRLCGNFLFKRLKVQVSTRVA